MKFHRPLSFALGALAIATTGVLGFAKIERLDLESMLRRADDAIVGTITHRHVFREDHPIAGPELYFTTLTIEGNSLTTGEPAVVDVTFWGGFVDAENGVWNSEAPSEDDQKLGNEVVAFYRWVDNMGADVSANVLYASHGGIYRVATTRRGSIVLGRGLGYAIEQNTRLDRLTDQVVDLHERIEAERQEQKR